MKYISDLIGELIGRNSESGVEIDSQYKYFKHGISFERYDILTDKQSKYYNKDKGSYELLSIPDVLYMTKKQIEYSTKVVCDRIKSLIGDIDNSSKILVVGLGNRRISSDSLGAKVVGRIRVTFEGENLPRVMAISPSVSGLTGIETVNIVTGVVNQEKPTHMILIDSLCAKNISRLGKSIQLSNTGICPGSGVGNKRKCIGKNLVKNTISIGVPLLIYASTFIENAFEENNLDYDTITKLKKENTNEIYSRLISVYNYNCDDVVVSIKDIEECVDILSKIIADAINQAIGVGIE